MHKYKAVLFDLDGTLLDTLEDLAVSMNSVLKKHGYPSHETDEYRYFVIPTGLTEDKIVKALEMRPDNKKIVHHALFFEDITGKARENDAATPEYGFDGFGGFAGDDTEKAVVEPQPQMMQPGFIPFSTLAIGQMQEATLKQLPVQWHLLAVLVHTPGILPQKWLPMCKAGLIIQV